MINFIRNTYPFYKPYKWLVLLGILFILLTNALQMAGPWLLRGAVNAFETGFDKHDLWVFAGKFILIAIFAGVFRYAMRKTLISVSRYIEYDIRKELYDNLIKLDTSFFDHARVGDLMTRLTSDIEQIRMVIGPALMYSVNTVFGFVFGISLMLLINVQMTSVMLLLAPLVVIVVFLLGSVVHSASMASQQAFSDLSVVVQENLSGIRVVKAFLQSDAQEKLFEEKAQTLKSKNLRLVIIRGAFMPAIMLLFGLGIAAILLLGGHLIMQDKLMIGDFVAFFSYMMLLTWPMIALGWVVSLFQRGRASFERVQALTSTDQTIVDGDYTGDSATSESKEHIIYENVGFSYNKDNNYELSDIQISLIKGNVLGVVGRVGTGKTTLISLLTRLYDVSEGKILVDGIDVRKWNKKALRSKIGIVPQDPLLFSTSIKNNITMFEEYSDEDVSKAIEISRLVQDIPDFPFGLETEVGERGITLSGGQKQRVAIARAVIRNPEILIFDDALSAVDTDTEEKILSNLDTFFEGRTNIIISHRLSSVVNADEIIVLEENHIVERGKHEDLIKLGGTYSDIFRKQELAAELEVQS